MIEFETEWVRQNSPDPADPTKINWAERQADAWLPFEVYKGRPICPDDWTVIEGKRGRNDMRLWGENKCADALVTATFNGVRYVLLVERADGLGWAMPGGGVDPGESAFYAAWRELREETGLELPYDSAFWALNEPRWVPDPRGSMEAWAVTVVAHCDLGPVDALPEVHPADGENRRVRWIGVGYLGWLADRIFPAHREILGALR